MKSLALLGVSALFLLSACGGDSDSATSPAKSSSADMEVATYEMLPSCAEKREGKTAYVKDQDQGYICQNEKWVENDDAVEVYPSSTERPSINNGYYTDSRDGKKYRTVTIGAQTWMAENLNYVTLNSYCYDDKAANCTKYGRLYTWAAAMDSAGTWSTNGKGCGYNKICSSTSLVRGACPEGWHLPSESEWNTLFTAVGGSSTAGTKLKSMSGWNSNGCGTDSFSFSALPTDSEGNNAYFWSSTESDSYYALYVDLYYSNDGADLYRNGKSHRLSVRCLKD